MEISRFTMFLLSLKKNHPTHRYWCGWMEDQVYCYFLNSGCSSMMGLLSEIGPYVFLRDGEMNLSSNPFSWNKEAHLLFIESPSDVGYSKNP